jgi:hypothetical protein
MEGKSGPMWTDDFVDLVHRNKYKPNIRFISSRWGERNRAPAGTCTLLVGAWLPSINTEERKTWRVHDDHVGAYNVALSQIPEFTQVRDDGEITHRGWKALLQILVNDRVIRPSREIEALLGTHQFEKTVRGLGCF